VAFENKTEVISGPNGMSVGFIRSRAISCMMLVFVGKMCVSVISSCECVSSCYRLPLKEQHLEIFTDSNGQTQQRWKVHKINTAYRGDDYTYP